MDIVWLALAFACGWIAQQLTLPPLVGFLAAGFGLRALGADGGELLQQIADLGITLLLFTIGLKLNLRSLLRPEIWAGTSLHMAITIVVSVAVLWLLGLSGLAPIAGLPVTTLALIAFALSFSSTVFAIKALESRGELSSRHGRVAIGILIMQDIIAVVFLAASSGKLPSAWAFLLLLLPLLKPFVMLIMHKTGHDELLLLFGLVAAIAGADLFELVGMKADLGALAFGVLLGGHRKSSELAKIMLHFKNLFLIGFFLTIGLSGLPGPREFGIALLLTLIMPFKFLLFFTILTRFHLRARTAMLTALNLSNYSEFGLIVAAIGVTNAWLSNEWLVIIALALSFSFIYASIFSSMEHRLYARFEHLLLPFESDTRLAEDEIVTPGDAEVLIFGLGRTGGNAYRAMREDYGDRVCGVDYDQTRVDAYKKLGWRVIRGDATDADFWRAIDHQQIRMVMLALPSFNENLAAVKELRSAGYPGFIAATAHFDDERARLESAGADAAFNIFAEAGAGFAAHARSSYESPRRT